MMHSFRILFWVLFAAVALSGFSFAIREEMTLSGYPLLLHVGLTPLFTVLFLGWILQKTPLTQSLASSIDFLFAVFLTFLLLSLIASSMINFYPWLRPEEQKQTLIIHRAAAILFTVTILLNALVSVIRKKKIAS